MADSDIQLTIDDTSPTISYSPFSDTLSTPNIGAGWNPYYDVSGFASAPGETGNGTTYHITSLDGASLALQWHGTGIQLFGNTTLSSYTITLDGDNIVSDMISTSPSSSSTTDGILADIQGLRDATHTVTLTAQIPQDQNPLNSSILVFDKAVIRSSPLPVSSSNITFSSQALDDNNVAFLGRWSFATSPSGASFHSSSTAGDRATTTFQGTTFAMQGMTSPSAGSYTVTLDNVTSPVLSGKSSFTTYDSILFFASGLDSGLVHSVQVKNEDGGKLGLLVGGFSTFTPLTTPPSSSPTPASNASTSPSFPKGTIAAFILAGLLAFLLLSCLFFYCAIWRPRKRRRQKRFAQAAAAYAADARFSGYGYGGAGANGAGYEAGNQPMQERRWLGLALGFGQTPSAQTPVRSPKEQEAFVGLVRDHNRDEPAKEVNITDVANRLNQSPGAPYDQNLGHAQDSNFNNGHGHTAFTPTTSSGKSSGRSGWARWRREAMEGSIRGLGLPIRFKHSSNSLEKLPVSDANAAGQAELPYIDISPDNNRAAGGEYPYGYPHAYTPTRHGHERTRSGGTAGTDASSNGRKRNLKAIAMANLKNKGKARQITGANSSIGSASSPSTPGLNHKSTFGGDVKDLQGDVTYGNVPGTSRSWSSSFKVDFPMAQADNVASASGSKPKSRFGFLQWSPNRRQRSISDGLSIPPAGSATGTDAYLSERDRLSSFAAASPSSPSRRPYQQRNSQPIPELEALADGDGDHPPSYAASISHSRPGSEASSSLLPSVPRSVSRSHSNSNSTPNSPINPPRPVSLHHRHQREHSRRFLLHGDAESEEDSPPEPEVLPRPHPLPPPPRPASGSISQSQPPTPSYVAQAPISQQQRPVTSTNPLTLSIPVSGGRPPHGRDRGSASTEGDLPSVIGPGSTSMRQVLRSLSPRTSTSARQSAASPYASLGYVYSGLQPTRHSRIGEEGSISDSELGGSPVEFARNVSPSGVAGGNERSQVQARVGPSGDTPTSDVYTPRQGLLQNATQHQGHEVGDPNVNAEGVFLDVRSTSPFRVEFDSRSAREQNVTATSMSSEDSGIETAGLYYTAPSRQSNYKPSRRSSSDGVNVVSSSRSPEFVQGTSRTPFRLTNLTIPIPHQPTSHTREPTVSDEGGSDGVTSFLDLTNSREGSVRSRSLKTVGSHERVFGGDGSPIAPFPPNLMVPAEPRSRWSSTTVPTVSSQPVDAAEPAPASPTTHNSQGSRDSPSSQQVSASHSHSGCESIAGSNTFPISVHVTIPPSPHHIMDFQPHTIQAQSPVEELDERRQSHLSNLTQDNPVHVHPIIENIESPTESLPMSVSSAHFRHSDSEGDPSRSRRTTESSLAMRSHPALPGPISSVSQTLMTALRPGQSGSGTPSSFDNTPRGARFDVNSNNDLSNSDTSRTVG